MFRFLLKHNNLPAFSSFVGHPILVTADVASPKDINNSSVRLRGRDCSSIVIPPATVQAVQDFPLYDL